MAVSNQIHIPDRELIKNTPEKSKIDLQTGTSPADNNSSYNQFMLEQRRRERFKVSSFFIDLGTMNVEPWNVER